MVAIDSMVERFQQLSGMAFSSKAELVSQLFAHLAPALERCRFAIGIDNMLLEEVVRKYPRLMRTTQEALKPLEQEYGVHFSNEEAGLVAISFGAWLMQDNALQEKQVLLLTLDNPQLEEEVEYQIRELTLLPLNIKYLPLSDYLRGGAPQGITLVITLMRRCTAIRTRRWSIPNYRWKPGSARRFARCWKPLNQRLTLTAGGRINKAGTATAAITQNTPPCQCSNRNPAMTVMTAMPPPIASAEYTACSWITSCP